VGLFKLNDYVTPRYDSDNDARASDSDDKIAVSCASLLKLDRKEKNGY